MKLILIRHGQTQGNILNEQGINLFTGALNNKYTDLTEKGNCFQGFSAISSNYIWIYADCRRHLLANLLGLWYVGLYFEKKIGTIWFVLVYHIGLIFAGIILIVLYPSGYQYGASPAIFACIGVLANWLVKNRELWDEYKLQKGFYYLMAYFVLSNMLGVSTLIFHFMGFVVGFLLGFMVKERAR